jgi:hypothetical protein
MRMASRLAVVSLALACSSPAGAPPAQSSRAGVDRPAPPPTAAEARATPPSPSPIGPPAAPPPPAVPPRIATGDIGTRAPVVIEAVSPDGDWMAICQARADTDGDGKIKVMVGHHGDMQGDAMQAYLVRGAGPGEPIDALVAHDPSGRFAVIARRGELVLIDTAAGHDTVLPGGVTADDDGSFGGHRAASFDGDGRQLAYLRARGGGEEVVVRDLADGRERVVTPTAGKLWRAELDPGGQVLWLRVMERDTDGDGAVGPPQLRTSLSGRHCRGPVMSYSTGGWQGDRPTTWTARRADGWTARRDDDAIGTLGDALVRRRTDGALMIERAGAQREAVPAACAGRVMHADARTDTLYVACAARAVRDRDGIMSAPLERYRRGALTDLDERVQLVGEEDEFHRADPLLTVAARSARTHRVLNVETGTIGELPLGAPDAVIGDAVLMLPYPYESGRFFFDLRTGRRERLGVALGWESTRRAGDLLAIEDRAGGSVVLDLARRRAVGRVPVRALAVARSGHALVGSGHTRGVGRLMGLPRGPLRWVTPIPRKPAGKR